MQYLNIHEKNDIYTIYLKIIKKILITFYFDIFIILQNERCLEIYKEKSSFSKYDYSFKNYESNSLEIIEIFFSLLYFFNVFYDK